MTFGQPFLLLSLLAIPVAVGLYLLAERRRMRYAVRFTNLAVLAEVATRRPWRRYLAPALFLLALASLCVGLARPHVRTSVLKERATVILVIDVSGSMQSTDVAPTRLGAAQAAAAAFLDHVPKNLRVGLIAFAGEPEVAAPPTTDHNLVKQSLADIGAFPGFGGTAIGDALQAAVKLGQQAVQTPAAPGGQVISYVIQAAAAPTNKGLVSILFLSDGSQTRGTLQPLEGAALAKTAGFPVYTFALGTPGGTLTRGFGSFKRTIPVPPDPTTLKAIADTTGGQFLAAKSAESLQAAYTRLGSQLGRTPGHTEVTYRFLLAAAALLLAAGLLSALWSPRLP